MNPTQDMDDIKIIFACGECTFATTDRSELDSHLLSVHEKSEILHYDNVSAATVLPSSQQATLQYVASAPIMLAPISSEVSKLE